MGSGKLHTQFAAQQQPLQIVLVEDPYAFQEHKTVSVIAVACQWDATR